MSVVVIQALCPCCVVPTPCCNNGIPPQLIFQVLITTPDCPCADNFQMPMAYDSVNNWWFGTGSVCSSTIQLTMTCIQVSLGVFDLNLSGFCDGATFDSGNATNNYSCVPFGATWNLINTAADGCCPAGTAWTVRILPAP